MKFLTFQASTPLEIFDSTVQALTDAGLLVVSLGLQIMHGMK